MKTLDYSATIEILLVQPDTGEKVNKCAYQQGIESPISLTSLAAYLDKEGISNEILDMRIYDKKYDALNDTIKKLKPAVVGITSTTFEIENAARIAEIIKEKDKDVITVIGGAHASALPEETLKTYSRFDLLIHGEGELSFTHLVKQLENGQVINDIKGIGYRENGDIRINPREELITNLDDLPFPARHKVGIDPYAPNPGTYNYMTLPSTGIVTGRGCPYHCRFCYKGVWGKRVRQRSSDSIIREIEHCMDKYGIHDFRFYDDVFTIPKSRLIDFCNKVLDKGIKIHWNCWSRVDIIDTELLELMKQAGCYHIKYGIEFGTEKALKLAKKGITLDMARKAVFLTKEVGLECKTSFVLGIPGETIEDVRKTIDFAVELSPDLASFFAYYPVPGSVFYEDIKKGLVSEGNGMLTKEERTSLEAEALRTFYFRLSYIVQRVKKLLKNPKREISLVFHGFKMILRFLLDRSFRLS